MIIKAIDSACTSLPVQFFAKDISLAGAVINSRQWDFGTGGAAVVQQPEYAFTDSGHYSIQVAATNADGCTGLAMRPINILPTPLMEVSADTTICMGQTAVLKSVGTDSYN